MQVAVSDVGSIPRSGRSPGGGHVNLLQYSCLENPHGHVLVFAIRYSSYMYTHIPSLLSLPPFPHSTSSVITEHQPGLLVLYTAASS